MTLEFARPLASENLIRTYFALGAALPGAIIEQGDGYRACTGAIPHAVCNFAAELSLDPWSVRELREMAERRPNFHLYLVPGDGPSHARKLVERAGFAVSYELTQMTAEPTPQPTCISTTEAISPQSREAVARFMIDQFFTRQTSSFRRSVANATAHSELQLHYLQEQGELVGAVMLCVTPGVIGVYNLCVTPNRRSRGIGGGIVRWCLDLAARSESKLTLQCEERLAPWYEQFGFQRSGEVIVYSLPK